MDNCDFEGCKNPVAVNIQSAIITWEVVVKIGQYNDYGDQPSDIEADDQINLHLCEDHREQWRELI